MNAPLLNDYLYLIKINECIDLLDNPSLTSDLSEERLDRLIEIAIFSSTLDIVIENTEEIISNCEEILNSERDYFGFKKLAFDLMLVNMNDFLELSAFKEEWGLLL